MLSNKQQVFQLSCGSGQMAYMANFLNPHLENSVTRDLIGLIGLISGEKKG